MKKQSTDEGLVRGFNEVTSASGDYYQLWNGSTPTINYGSTGLVNFGKPS
jgi:hypothetical protein